MRYHQTVCRNNLGPFHEAAVKIAVHTSVMEKFFWLTFIFTECIYNRCSNVLCKVKNAIIRENQQTIPCEQHCFRVLLTGISADGCPSLSEKRRIKKERKTEHEQQTGKMQTTGERKVKCNDMWWWKSEKRGVKEECSVHDGKSPSSLSL